MDIKQVISSSSNWLGLKAKIDECTNTKDKGDIFELLTKLYLQLDPRYVSKLKTIWLYNEVPTNTLKKLNLPSKDMGIDLVAETNEGEYWAIQCKYKADESKSLTWREISTFQSLAFSKAKGISFGLVATTVDRSANVFKEQKEDVKLLAGEIWRELDAEFFQRAKKILARKVARPVPFKPRKHQQRAVTNAHQHFVSEKATRGKMIMPCGTGKSLTAYWIAKELEAKTIVIAVPSLSLINQTLKAWLREVIANKQSVDWIAICSDKTAGAVDSAISTQDLGIPTNTNPEFIAEWLRKHSKGLKVVFTTYQSGKVLAEASRIAKRVFDLGIMDEAHKTVGDRSKTFAHLLSDENIKIRKRVFMTATERRYAGSQDEIISMDNPEVYGDTFELLTFKEALEQEPPILSDYKILTILVHKEDVANYIQERAIVKPDRGKWDDGVQAEMLAGVIALQKAMQNYPIKHTVSFHTSIARAHAFKGNQQSYTEAIKGDSGQLETFFVSGKTPTSIRSRIIKEFASSDKALISNARCLTEGVDVPNIDGVLFADPKRSAVDIVQAVGRALRLSDAKDFGYIIIPVFVEDESGFEKSGAFQTILTVLRALASNDERIVEYFRDKANNEHSHDRRFTPELTENLLERVDLDQFIESIELQVWSKLARLSWRPFNEAREYVRSLSLSNQKEWVSYCAGGVKSLPTLPADIPASPHFVYTDDWNGYGDWLGTGNVANHLLEFLDFRSARQVVHSLEMPSVTSWRSYCRGEIKALPMKPANIPARPDLTYSKSGWVNWADWLGLDAQGISRDTAAKPVNKRQFSQARLFAQSLNITSAAEWRAYCRESEDYPPLPKDIPRNPNQAYKRDGWISWGDWLGTDIVASGSISFMKYEEAKCFVHKLNLNSLAEWDAYIKGDFSSLPNIPENIPRNPLQYYKKQGEWVSVSDWLGNKRIADIDKRELFPAAEEFKRLANQENILTAKQYRAYYAEKKVDTEEVLLPYDPVAYYKEFNSWGDISGRYHVRHLKKLPFADARSFVQKLSLASRNEWRKYCKGDFPGLPERPVNLPTKPDTIYLDQGWSGWPDFLGYKQKKKRN